MPQEATEEIERIDDDDTPDLRVLASRAVSDSPLAGKRVAILATDGVEQVELTKPRQALLDAGAEVVVISLKSGEIQAYNHAEKGDKIGVDVAIEKASAARFDALMLPGGVANPDRLRTNERAVAFVRAFVEGHKPIAAICHAAWTLINAGGVDGKRMTSWPSLRVDLTNAGAQWVDEAVVVDGRLLTSRKPDDLPVFNARMIELFRLSESHARH
jgi:protease I